MVSRVATGRDGPRGVGPANDRSAVSPRTSASARVLASWLASGGAATGPDVSGFMAVLRDTGRLHGVHARRSSCSADGYLSPCLSLCPPHDGVGRVGGLRRNRHRHADVASWIGPPVEEPQPG